MTKKEEKAMLIFERKIFRRMYKVKVHQSVTGLEWPRGFQEVKVPRFHDNGTGRW